MQKESKKCICPIQGAKNMVGWVLWHINLCSQKYTNCITLREERAPPQNKSGG